MERAFRSRLNAFRPVLFCWKPCLSERYYAFCFYSSYTKQSQCEQITFRSLLAGVTDGAVPGPSLRGKSQSDVSDNARKAWRGRSRYRVPQGLVYAGRRMCDPSSTGCGPKRSHRGDLRPHPLLCSGSRNAALLSRSQHPPHLLCFSNAPRVSREIQDT